MFAINDFLLSGKYCIHQTMSERPGVGGVLHQIVGREVWHMIKKDPIRNACFVKMRGQ